MTYRDEFEQYWRRRKPARPPAPLIAHGGVHPVVLDYLNVQAIVWRHSNDGLGFGLKIGGRRVAALWIRLNLFRIPCPVADSWSSTTIPLVRSRFYRWVANNRGKASSRELQALRDVYLGRCLSCGDTATCFDHIIPVVAWTNPMATSGLSNQQPLCKACNSRKWGYCVDYRINKEHLMTPERIRALRQALGESVETFAARFHRSGRTAEDWEQGRRSPDPVVIAMMVAEEVKLAKKRRPKNPPKKSDNKG